MADTFDLDAAYAEARQEPFRFTWKGQDWELAFFGDLDWRAAGLAKEIEALADGRDTAEVTLDMLDRLFTYGLGPEQADRWDKVQQNVGALTLLFEAWQKHAGTSVGESPASTSSSGSTGRPSKRTSRATTKSASRARSTAPRKSA